MTDILRRTWIEGRDPLPTPKLDSVCAIAKEFAEPQQKARYKWIAMDGDRYMAQGTSAAYCASDVLYEAAHELAQQELFSEDQEPLERLTITVEWIQR